MARKRLLILHSLAVLLCVTSAELIVADGIQDNITENVRRIPELGVPVPDDRAASMREQLGKLQEKIAQIHSSDDAKAKALLPDVMIFERAVRCALDYNEFFDVKEFDKADELLKHGIARAEIHVGQVIERFAAFKRLDHRTDAVLAREQRRLSEPRAAVDEDFIGGRAFLAAVDRIQPEFGGEPDTAHVEADEMRRQQDDRLIRHAAPVFEPFDADQRLDLFF